MSNIGMVYTLLAMAETPYLGDVQSAAPRRKQRSRPGKASRARTKARKEKQRKKKRQRKKSR